MQYQPSPEPISRINDAAEGSVDDSCIANSDLSGSAGNVNRDSITGRGSYDTEACLPTFCGSKTGLEPAQAKRVLTAMKRKCRCFLQKSSCIKQAEIVNGLAVLLLDVILYRAYRCSCRFRPQGN